jgi:hypothetical protein
MTLNVVHTDNAPVTQTKRTRILVMGPAARGIAGALLRMQSSAEICAADSPAQAVDYLKTGDFDHLLIDNRADGAMSLSIPRLAQLDTVGKLTVLSGSKSKELIKSVVGVDQVIVAPYNPVDIAGALDIEIVDNRTQGSNGTNQGRRETDLSNVAGAASAPEVTPDTELQVEATGASTEEVRSEHKRPILVRAFSVLARFIPSLTPIISLIYKNLALVILGALFMAFVSYGIMIAYFLLAADWSSPIQIQRGHELAIKAERERGELKVKRNLVLKQLSDAQGKADRGRDRLNQAAVLEQIAKSTIEQEIQNYEAVVKQSRLEAADFTSVLNSYGSRDQRAKERKSLASAYKRRIITNNYYQESLLNFSQIEENVVRLRERIALKNKDEKLALQSIDYLIQLQFELQSKQTGTRILRGKAEFVPIANQILEVEQLRDAARADMDEYENTVQTFNNSLQLLSSSIAELEATPMIRALEQPVNALFVPYDNLDNYTSNDGLYACAFAIFWCHKIGTVGAPIPGEIKTIHPFFGKPMRGQFVEANFTDASAVKKEIIHVGRPPLFF